MSELKGKDSIMKLLLSRPNNSSGMTRLDGLSRDGGSPSWESEETESSRLSSYLQKLSGQIDGKLSTVELDHAYSRPWNWRPENSYTKPVRTLFVPRPVNSIRSGVEEIDVVGESEEITPVYDAVKVKSMMEEIEKLIHLVRPEPQPPTDSQDINKSDWNRTQMKVYEKACRLLDEEMLGRLSVDGGWNEGVLRRLSLTRSARRWRHLVAEAGITLAAWLHVTLMHHLDTPTLVAYVDILQSLKSKVPALVDRMVANYSGGRYNPDALNMLLQRSWHPANHCLPSYNPKKLPGNPILLIVPSGVGKVNRSRLQKWQTYLSQLATVVNVNLPPNLGGSKVTVMSSLEQMMSATRSKILELKSDYVGNSIILIGFNTGAALACQVALLEQGLIAAVVCLGFPMSTVDDKRGQPDDGLLNLSIPVLFVIGQHSSTASVDDMEELRERLHVETGLVVVGAADDQLRVDISKQAADGITQDILDRCIVDEVGDFVGTILSNPYSSSRGGSGTTDSRQRLRLVKEKRKVSIQDEVYRKKPRGEGGGGRKVRGGGGQTPRPAQITKKWTAHLHRAFDITKPNQGGVASITRSPGSAGEKTRPAIENISIINTGQAPDVDDPSNAKLLSQIKVVGRSEMGGVVSGDSLRLVEELTPSSLLEMPVIIAHEDTPTPTHSSPTFKVVVGGGSSPVKRSGGQSYTKILVHQKKKRGPAEDITPLTISQITKHRS